MGFVVEVVALLGIIDLKGAATTYCIVSPSLYECTVWGSGHLLWHFALLSCEVFAHWPSRHKPRTVVL